MRSLLWSYLGSRRFPREVSTFEVRRFFTLSSDDRHVLRRRFRSRSRLGAALQLGFVRVTGTPQAHQQSRLRGGKQGCLDVFDGLVCTHWGGRHEVGAGTCQGFTNR
jgi:hypothetical protein